MPVDVRNEKFVCPVCYTHHTYRGGILLDITGGEPVEMGDATIIGYKMCEEHDALQAKDYVFILGIDHEKSKFPPGTDPQPHQVWRTGSRVQMTAEQFAKFFDNMPVPEGRVMYAPESVIFSLSTVLESLVKKKKGKRNGRPH